MIQNIDDLSYEASKDHTGYYNFVYKGEIVSDWNLSNWIDMNRYDFKNLMEQKYKAESLPHGDLYVHFKDEKTIIEVLDWMKSIILSRVLAEDTDSWFIKILKKPMFGEK